MAKNEKSGGNVGKIASKGLRDPGSLSKPQIKTLAASALTQRPDHKAPPKSTQTMATSEAAANRAARSMSSAGTGVGYVRSQKRQSHPRISPERSVFSRLLLWV